MGAIRLILAIHVLFNHINVPGVSHLSDGMFAVQMFFIISGFYISFVFLEKYSLLKNGTFLFLSNRFLRIFPSYWFVYIVYVIAVGLYCGFDHENIFINVDLYEVNLGLFFSLLFSQVLILGQDLFLFLKVELLSGSIGYTNDFSKTSPVLHQYMFNLPGWTLALELYFYLIAPLLLKKKRIVIIVFFFSLVTRFITWNFLHYKHDPWTYRFFPQELCFFTMGYFSYLIYKKTELSKIKISLCKLLYPIFLVSVLLYGGLEAQYNKNVPIDLRTVAYSIALVLLMPYFFKVFKQSKIDRILGDFSYPLYVSHFIAIRIWGLFPLDSGLPEGLEKVLYSVVLTVLVYVIVESRLSKLRQARLKTSGPQTILEGCKE